jgi:hypothetical protein
LGKITRRDNEKDGNIKYKLRFRVERDIFEKGEKIKTMFRWEAENMQNKKNRIDFDVKKK